MKLDEAYQLILIRFDLLSSRYGCYFYFMTPSPVYCMNEYSLYHGHGCCDHVMDAPGLMVGSLQHLAG